jgi:hypothetical protein
MSFQLLDFLMPKIQSNYILATAKILVLVLDSHQNFGLCQCQLVAPFFLFTGQITGSKPGQIWFLPNL